MRAKSLAGRLYLGAVVWMALAMAIGGVVLAQAFRDSVERGFEQRLQSVLRAVVAGVEIAPDGSVQVAPALAEPRFEDLYSGWYWQVSGEEGPLERSRSLWDYAFPVAAGRVGGALQTRADQGPRGEPVMLIERDLNFPQRDEPLHVIVAASRADIDREVARFRFLLALSLGGLGLGLLAAVAVQVRYGMRPLRTLAADLERLRGGGGARLSGDYPSEIRPLVEATNKVLDHDAALIERARTHVGNLAHALKTPLAILKAESAAKGGDPVIEAQIRRMDKLVEHHLARARAVATAAPPMAGRSRVADVVDELVPMIEKIFADKGIAIRNEVPADAEVAAGRDDLAEMLGNLLENAAKYARHQARISARGEGADLVLTVEDDGPGMTDAEAREAMERGARLDETIPGWGLGLAIVGDLAALHGGSLRLGRSALGGLAVDLALPKDHKY